MSDVLLTLQLHPKQAEIRSSAKRFNVLNCGRRFGKTTLAVDVLSEYMLDGWHTSYWTPTYKMLAEVWREITNKLQPITSDKSVQEHRLELVTGGVVDMWSLENADAGRGRKGKLAIIDEAAQDPALLEHWEMVIRPSLMDLRGDAWFLSTPNGRNGFYHLHCLGRDTLNDEWKSWTYTSYDNPFIHPQELDALKGTISELAFRQEIMAEFLEGSGTVFRNLKATTCAPADDVPDVHRGHSVGAGVDWGKQNDFTVISVGCATCRRELFLDRFNQIDYAFQVQRLKGVLHRWGVQTCTVEMNSIGTPLFEQLQREGLNVMGFDTTAVSKPPLIEGLSLELEKGTIQLINDPVGTSELEAYERKVNENTGRSSYGAPEGMHDDTVIARALMLKTINNMPRIQPKRQVSPFAQVNFGGR